MQPFIQQWLGYPRPKQYCTFLGTRSMLQHTWDRADHISGPKNKVTIIDQSHDREILNQLEVYSGGKIIRQPRNCDTAVGIFLGLAYVDTWDPDATVTLFPSDHFIFPQKTFNTIVRGAMTAAERLTDQVIVLGASPDAPESEYGWVAPGLPLAWSQGYRVRSVAKFFEKPDQKVCEKLYDTGGLWNTMIVTAKVRTLWKLGEYWCPEVMERLRRFRKTIGSPEEYQTLESLYKTMPIRNFSRHLLEKIVDKLAIIELRGVVWSDWGQPKRICDTLCALDIEPSFQKSLLAS
jgi:mannose-1-phosphate guanylyltransferase